MPCPRPRPSLILIVWMSAAASLSHSPRSPCLSLCSRAKSFEGQCRTSELRACRSPLPFPLPQPLPPCSVTRRIHCGAHRVVRLSHRTPLPPVCMLSVQPSRTRTWPVLHRPALDGFRSGRRCLGVRFPRRPVNPGRRNRPDPSVPCSLYVRKKKRVKTN